MNNETPNPWQAPQTNEPEARPEPSAAAGDYRRPNFDTAVAITKELWNNHLSTLLTTWGVYAGIWLVTSLAMAFAGVALGVDPASQQEALENMPTGPGGDPFAVFDMFGEGYWAFMGLAVLLGFMQVGVAVGTFRPLRRAYTQGRVLSASEVLGDMGSGIIPGAVLYLVFTLGVTIGAMLCCIPGLLVAYFMLPTFYLVGGRGDGIFDSISTGFGWGKRHIGLLVILIAITVGVVIAFSCVGGVIGQLMMSMGKAGYIVSQLVSWFFGVFFGFFAWIFYAGTMLTIEQAEDHSLGW